MMRMKGNPFVNATAPVSKKSGCVGQAPVLTCIQTREKKKGYGLVLVEENTTKHEMDLQRRRKKETV